MKTHHLEYTEGGILDMDDLLTDLVEDRDKVGHFAKRQLSDLFEGGRPQPSRAAARHFFPGRFEAQ